MATLYRVTLPVRDLEAAVRFYRTLLAEDGDVLGQGWHSFSFKGATLLLHEADAPVHAEPLYVAIDEPLIQVHYRAQGLGAQYVDASMAALPTGEMAFLLRDPSGNAVYVVDARTVPWHLYGPSVGSSAPAAAAPSVEVSSRDASTLTLQRDFLAAVKGGDLQTVQDLLLLDPELIETTDQAGVSVLMLAAYKQQHAVAEHLLQQMPELNIFEAAAFNRVGRLAELLELEPQATLWSVDGFTPLGLACFFGHPDCVKLLLVKGADPNAPARNLMKVKPLHSAISRAPEAVVLANVRSLIDARADVNATQQGGYTPLHQAADRGLESVVRLLMGAGARSDLRAENGRLPAHLARAKGHQRVLELLVSGV